MKDLFVITRKDGYQDVYLEFLTVGPSWTEDIDLAMVFETRFEADMTLVNDIALELNARVVPL